MSWRERLTRAWRGRKSHGPGPAPAGGLDPVEDNGSMGTQKAVQVLIDGRVQGVGFRWECSTVAEQLGVKGWVRNLPDGRVEAHFEGDQGQLDQIVQWAHEGPSYASVRKVTVTDVPAEGMRNFSVA